MLTYEQLLAAGLSKRAIARRVEQGRLQRLWQGVYLVGPTAPHPLSLAQGGVASCTSAAFVSHRWVPYVLGFGEVPDLPVDVTVVAGSRRGRPGKVRVHHSRLLTPRDTTIRRGIAVTTAAWAILDIAETATIAEIEKLIADAQVAKVLTETQLHDVLDRADGRRGAPKVRAILSETLGITLSDAERILRRILREAGIEQPLTNYRIGRYRADFAWPQYELIVEFDGFATHGHRRAFHHDRRRNAELAAQGWTVMPVTWDQLANEPLAVVARIARAIAVRSRA